MTEGKTLYVSDLDGTLLNQHAVLSDYTKKALNQLITYGIDFTVATARTIDATKKLMVKLPSIMPLCSFVKHMGIRKLLVSETI